MFPRWSTMSRSSWSTLRVLAAVCPTWRCTRWCSRSLDQGMRSIPSRETWRTWVWGFKAVPHVTSGILFGILSDILSGILSDILSGILSGILSRHFGHNFLGGPPYTLVLCRSGWSGKLPIFAACWSTPCCCASALNRQGARRFAFWSSSCRSSCLMKATSAI